MLVLRRKLEEGLLIDGKIRVRILGIEGDNVKLGIEAPRDVTIHRSEVSELLEQRGSVLKKVGQGA